MSAGSIGLLHPGQRYGSLPSATSTPVALARRAILGILVPQWGTPHSMCSEMRKSLASFVPHWKMSVATMAAENRRGIKSVEVAGQILDHLARAQTAVPLRELAVAGRMSPGKVHRYL